MKNISKELEELIKKNFEEYSNFRRAISDESDRGCALFSAAYLDQSLKDALGRLFVLNKRMDDDLFGASSALSSFSSRIKMAYYLGLISSDIKHDLEIIRKIRNGFAHHSRVMSFEDKELSSSCQSLRLTFRDKKSRPRAHFTASATAILASLHFLNVKRIGEKPNLPIDDAMKAEIRARADEHAKKEGLSSGKAEVDALVEEMFQFKK